MPVVVLMNRFPQIAAALRPACRIIEERTALVIVADMQNRAPVRTGFMRDSIHTEGGADQISVVVGAFYGIFLEFGTRKMPAQPFFYPAIEAGRATFEAMGSALESLL